VTRYPSGKRARLEPWLNRGKESHVRFHFSANIAHYKELLATETDARKIATVRMLLADEEGKLADWRGQNQRAKAAK
jgi:hypothetical protein